MRAEPLDAWKEKRVVVGGAPKGRKGSEATVSDDREIARRSLDLQARARDYRLLDLPGYLKWSERKLAEGESEAFIAHLDATSCCLLPEEAAKMAASDFEELLEEVKFGLAKG